MLGRYRSCVDDRERVIVLRRKAMHYVSLYGLERSERLELSEMILRRDVTSWTELDEPQMLRVLDALEGFGLICHLLQIPVGGERPADAAH